MAESDRRVKKQYRRPVLRRYGDLRTMTRGGARKNNELNQFSGPKTRLIGGAG